MQGQDDGGVIVNMASVSGLRPSPGTAAYGAAKAGLLNLTQSLAVEWAPKVRVNAVSAGLVATEAGDDHYGGPEGIAAVAATVPLGRFGTPARRGRNLPVPGFSHGRLRERGERGGPRGWRAAGLPHRRRSGNRGLTGPRQARTGRPRGGVLAAGRTQVRPGPGRWRGRGPDVVAMPRPWGRSLVQE